MTTTLKRPLISANRAWPCEASSRAQRPVLTRGFVAEHGWLRIVVVACLIAASRAGADHGVTEGGSPERPNVVWIVLDACRAKNLSCYGYERPTSPHIDRLAERGAVFLNHFAQGNQTRLSVPSYMTGLYFPTYSLSGGRWREMWRVPGGNERLIPTIMRENGYRTGIFSAHAWLGNVESRLYRDFGTCCFRDDTLSVLVTSVLDWVTEERNRPFFAYVHAMETHFPHRLESPYERWVRDLPVRAWHVSGYIAPGQEVTEVDRAIFEGLHDGSILMSDAAVGALATGLESHALLDNTVFVIMSDHGDALAEDGKTLGHKDPYVQDEVIRVPLILAGPGVCGGARVGELTENVDVVPTLVELLGLDTDAAFDGGSLVPLLGGTGAWRPKRYTLTRQFGEGRDTMPVFVLRDFEHKYVYHARMHEEQLWRVPDTVADRVACTGPRCGDIMATVRGWVEAVLLPKWEAHSALPYEPQGPFIEYIGNAIDGITPKGAVVSKGEQSWTDNRWTLMGDASISALISSGWQEDAPAVSFALDVPNGTYDVKLEMHTGIRDGHPASAILFRAEDDAKPKVVKPPQEAFDGLKAAGEYAYRSASLGRYTVCDGRFDVTLDEAGDGHWAVIRAFKFMPVDQTERSMTDEEQDEQTARIEALGYLD